MLFAIWGDDAAEVSELVLGEQRVDNNWSLSPLPGTHQVAMVNNYVLGAIRLIGKQYLGFERCDRSSLEKRLKLCACDDGLMLSPGWVLISRRPPVGGEGGSSSWIRRM